MLGVVELYCHGAQVNQMVVVDAGTVVISSLTLFLMLLLITCSLLLEIIPFSGDSSRTGPFCASPVAYSIIHPPIEGESTSIENQSWFSFGCDRNEMSVAATVPFFIQSWTC